MISRDHCYGNDLGPCELEFPVTIPTGIVTFGELKVCLVDGEKLFSQYMVRIDGIWQNNHKRMQLFVKRAHQDLVRLNCEREVGQYEGR